METVKTGLWLAMGAALLAAGLISGKAGAETDTVSEQAIAQLAFRDRTVVITNAPTGPQYTLLDAAGEILVSNLSEAELAADYPDLHQHVRTMTATPEDTTLWGGIFLDK